MYRRLGVLYSWAMEISVTAFRAELARHLQRAHDGEEIVVTDRGVPVARLCPLGERSLIDELIRDGVLQAPSGPKPRAGHGRPVKSRGSVSDVLVAQRG
jgi:prevent-host-death family protein